MDSISSSGMLTTSALQTAVAGRDYTTLYTVDPHGASGARIGVKAIRSDASAIIVSSPAGQVVAQSRVGIQIGQAHTWFPLQTNMKFGQPIQVAAGGSTIITTDGVHAWWTMPYMTKKIQGGWAARIMVRDIAGHEPLKIAGDKAKLPVAVAGGRPPSTNSRRFDRRAITCNDAGDENPKDRVLFNDDAGGISLVLAAGNILAWALPPKSQEAAPWRATKWHGHDARIR